MLPVIDTVRPSILYAHRYVFVVQPLQLAAWLVAAASHCAPADTSHPYGCLLGGFRGFTRIEEPADAQWFPMTITRWYQPYAWPRRKPCERDFNRLVCPSLSISSGANDRLRLSSPALTGTKWFLLCARRRRCSGQNTRCGGWRKPINSCDWLV